MYLQSIKLENFKGIREGKLEFDKKRNSIFGPNASGKSTYYDAFLWLLFDSDSRGAKDFGIKTLDHEGQPIPMVDHSVSAVLMIDNQDVVLKKVFSEVWRKKRGEAEAKFTGHETAYFVNGVPKSQREYQDFVASICDEQVFRTLTNPVYFNEKLHWKDRRQVLLTWCGSGVTDQAVIASNPDFAPLAAKLEKYSADDLKKMLAAQRKEINAELVTIPARVDEATKAMPETEGNSEALMNKAKKVAEYIAALQNEKVAAANGGTVQAIKNQIAEVEGELIQLRNQHAASSPDVSEELSEKNKAHQAKQDAEYQIGVLQNALALLQTTENNLIGKNKDLFQRFKAKSAETFPEENTCPTCGQEYPAEQRAQHLEAFNLAKSEAITQMDEEGRSNKAKIQEVRQEMEAVNRQIVEHGERAEAASVRITELCRIIEGKQNVPRVEELPEWKEIGDRKADLERQLSEALAGNQGLVNELAASIEAKQKELDEINRAITTIDTAATQKHRIEELKAREKELAQQYADSERELNMIEGFIRSKVSMLTDEISGKFSLVKFKLFEDQINGGLNETCICTVNGVPYPDLNTAGRVQAGLDIIKTLSAAYNFNPVVWIDNRESVTDIPEMNGQTISLVVSPTLKTIEVQ